MCRIESIQGRRVAMGNSEEIRICIQEVGRADVRLSQQMRLILNP